MLITERTNGDRDQLQRLARKEKDAEQCDRYRAVLHPVLDGGVTHADGLRPRIPDPRIRLLIDLREGRHVHAEVLVPRLWQLIEPVPLRRCLPSNPLT